MVIFSYVLEKEPILLPVNVKKTFHDNPVFNAIFFCILAKSVLRLMEKICRATDSVCAAEKATSCKGYNTVLILVDRFDKTDR